MATSKVAIANGALQRLGAKRIESLTQDHPNARSMNVAYDPVRKALLRKYAWSFSIRRASVAADGSQTAWGEHNRYTLPNDYVRLLRDDESGIAVDWKIEAGDMDSEGRFIITDDSSPLQFKYIASIEDPNMFDDLFIEAFECALAHKACKEITGSDSRKAEIKADLNDAVAEARNSNAIEKEAQEFPEDSWLLARN